MYDRFYPSSSFECLCWVSLIISPWVESFLINAFSCKVLIHTPSVLFLSGYVWLNYFCMINSFWASQGSWSPSFLCPHPPNSWCLFTSLLSYEYFYLHSNEFLLACCVNRQRRRKVMSEGDSEDDHQEEWLPQQQTGKHSCLTFCGCSLLLASYFNFAFLAVCVEFSFMQVQQCHWLAQSILEAVVVMISPGDYLMCTIWIVNTKFFAAINRSYFNFQYLVFIVFDIAHV